MDDPLWVVQIRGRGAVPTPEQLHQILDPYFGHPTNLEHVIIWTVQREQGVAYGVCPECAEGTPHEHQDDEDESTRG